MRRSRIQVKPNLSLRAKSTGRAPSKPATPKTPIPPESPVKSPAKPAPILSLNSMIENASKGAQQKDDVSLGNAQNLPVTETIIAAKMSTPVVAKAATKTTPPVRRNRTKAKPNLSLDLPRKGQTPASANSSNPEEVSSSTPQPLAQQNPIQMEITPKIKPPVDTEVAAAKSNKTDISEPTAVKPTESETKSILKSTSKHSETKDKDNPSTAISAVTSRKTKQRASRYKVSFDPDNPPDRTKMTMRDLIHWNPSANPMKYTLKKKNAVKKLSAEDSEDKAPLPTETEEKSVADDDNESVKSGDSNPAPAPQLTIGPDGNIVLNEESLYVAAETGGPKSPIIEQTVEEDENYVINSLSFRNYIPTKNWTERETKRFYRALSTLGTDFSLIQKMFPTRTRNQLRNKFKREERLNKSLVDMAIAERRHFDVSIFDESSDEEPPLQQEKATVQKSSRKRAKKQLDGENPDKSASGGSTAKKRRQKKSIKQKMDEDLITDSEIENEAEVDEMERELNKADKETNESKRTAKGSPVILSSTTTSVPQNSTKLYGSPQVQYIDIEQIMSRVRQRTESMSSSRDTESPRLMSPPRVLMSPPPPPNQTQLQPPSVDVNSLKPGEVFLLTVQQPPSKENSQGLVHVYMVSNDSPSSTAAAYQSPQPVRVFHKDLNDVGLTTSNPVLSSPQTSQKTELKNDSV